MDNPLSRLAPQLFGEYPKPFMNLVEAVSVGPGEEKDEIKSLLWKAYEYGGYHHEGQKRRSGEKLFYPLCCCGPKTGGMENGYYHDYSWITP